MSSTNNTQEHLIAIAIGPVQDFIAAARRTGDLTAGSTLLSDIAKATAKSLEANGARLIFPASSNDDGPNKILATLPVGKGGKDPCTVAEEARRAAKNELKRQWDEVKKRGVVQAALVQPLADAQVEAFLEFYAAWVPVVAGGYKTARGEVDAKLAARKNLRDFAPSPISDAFSFGKSSLDPAWECVLTSPMPEPGRYPFYLKKTEYLDAVSLLKRVKGKQGQKGGVPSTRDFAERRNHLGAFTEQEEEKDETEEKEPSYPYFAILVADGDNMGTLLDAQDSEEAHHALSAKLVEFCTTAKQIVKDHDGYPVYAGGDDVLAFLPVHRAVKCATQIREAFMTILPESAKVGKKKSGLSAGVAIVHYKEPLAHSLGHARDAERAAKDGGRDSLCLATHTRGGVPFLVTQRWADWGDFDTWIQGFEKDQLTRGVAYELKNLVKECSGTDISEEILRGEAQRIWERKQPEGITRLPFPELPQKTDPPKTYMEKLAVFADVLIAARFLTGETK
jgi:CRISPR-associated protein Cmr2